MIVKLIEYFILKNPLESVKCIVSYNIFSFFVSYISMPKYQNVRHLFTCLIDPSDEYLGLDKEIKILLWKHCQNSGHIIDLMSLMVNPLKGLLSQEGYLEKNIDAKILIDEVERTNIITNSRQPLGLKMFNYKHIDLDNERIFEVDHPGDKDIDLIRDTLDFKISKKNTPQSQAHEQYKPYKTAHAHQKSELHIGDNTHSSSFIPLSSKRKTSAWESEKEVNPSAGMEFGVEAKMKRLSSRLMGESDKADQERVNQKLLEIQTKPEDAPKIRKFMDYYFNELVHKELKMLEELANKSKVQIEQKNSKGTFLHEYLPYLRSKVSLELQSYSWKRDQLDGSVLGERKISFYPCKVKATNCIE